MQKYIILLSGVEVTAPVCSTGPEDTDRAVEPLAVSVGLFKASTFTSILTGVC